MMPVLPTLLSLVTACAAVAAVWHYIHTDQHRMAETFIKLEERFRELQPAARMIDPAAGESQVLIEALSASLTKASKTAEQRDVIIKFEELMRFFVLVGRLHHGTFLRQGELISMYAYWLAALRDDPVLNAYVTRYFPSVKELAEQAATARQL